VGVGLGEGVLPGRGWLRVCFRGGYLGVLPSFRAGGGWVAAKRALLGSALTRYGTTVHIYVLVKTVLQCIVTHVFIAVYL
jgi:hypothetical protein